MKVLKSGVQTLIQDGGRTACYQWGLARGGAADAVAFAWANRLCGNPVGTPALEVAVGDLSLHVSAPCRVAFCGAQMPIKINGESTDAWRSYDLSEGDELSVGYAQSGVMGYLAVTGGFRVEPLFGSAATVVREHLGGFDGRALATGDVLTIGEAPLKTPSNLAVPSSEIPKYSDSITLRLVQGYQHDQFTQSLLSEFYQTEFVVAKDSNAMGYRFEGKALNTGAEPLYSKTMYSEGIALGAVQLPANGLPIVMLRDRQTIGGYPKLGSVVAGDVNRLAQRRAGQRVRFQPVTLEQAADLAQFEKRRFEQAALIELDT